MKNSLRSLLALSTACVLGSLASAQPASLAGAGLGREAKKDVPYKITRGDILTVAVLNEPDLTAGGKRVESVGTVNLQLVGDVRVVGMTLKEASATIAASYSDQRYLRNPTVNVNVDTYAPRSVRVNGKVNSQGQVNLPPDTEWTIIDVIIKANGLGETARGKEVKVTRIMPDGQLKVFILDVESVLKAKGKSNEPAATFVVEPDDIIYVPEKII